MSGYLSRLKAQKSGMPLPEVLTKPTKPPSVSFVSEPEGSFAGKIQAANPVNLPPQTKEEAMPKFIWKNRYPKGSPAARVESLRVCAAARRGETI
ncbi:MAG TPA: hypothetical protein PK528_13895 [Syntrophorhabdus sp.]|nr:hypothetical protein [Syntrophorhabdus sp.]